MKTTILRVCLSLTFVFLSFTLYAQEKTQSYYNTHENEILPDAQSAFQRGRYERAKELCLWHYIIVGSHAADNLRDQAERCAMLTKEMESYISAGKMKEAKGVASKILSINPLDKSAKDVYQTPDPLVVEKVPSIDSVAIKALKEPLRLKSKEKESIDKSLDSEMAPAFTNLTSKKEMSSTSVPDKSDIRQFLFVVKAGITANDLSDDPKYYIGGNLGLYNLIGNRLGVEVGCAFGSIIRDETYATVFSAHLYDFYNIALVYRLTRLIYPKAEVGLREYRYKTIDKDYFSSRIDGLCYGVGVTFLLGGHFCLEASAKYTLNGIAPSIAIGWAF